MTTELKAKDFLLHYLKREYSKRSKVINNLTIHVERLHKDYLLTNIKRTDYLKVINNLIRLLNITYNSRLDTIKGVQDKDKCCDSEFDKPEEGEIVEKIKFDKITNLEKNLCDILKTAKSKPEDMNDETKRKMLNIMYGLSYTMYEAELKPFTPYDFKIFDEKLKKLITSVGCKNIADSLLIFSKGFENLIDVESPEELSLLEILNNSFVPLKISTKKITGKKSIKISRYIPSTQEKFESLLGNIYKVDINLSHSISSQENQLCVVGFFEYDCVNASIRTSSICNEYLHNRRKHLENVIEGQVKSLKGAVKLTTIQTTFKELFLKNLNLGEIIGLDDASFISEMCSDYAFYQKYSSSVTFKFVFADFISGNLATKFKIIKYLLLGSSVGDAGILFGSTRESKAGSVYVADIIYKNLSLPLQLKLCKENVSIKAELEKLSKLENDDIDMKKQIMLNKNMPQKVKKLVLEKLNEMKSGGSEYYKQLMYVKAVMDYPWIGEHDDDIFSRYKNDPEKWKEIMVSAKNKLNEKVYGHAECKETIVELLAKWFTNPNSLGKAIGLHGGPGIGKTLLGMELSSALGLPFAKINLAGVDDNSILIGHSSTYSGSSYGAIVKKMTETQKSRCILFFDELDKTALHHGRNEITDVLIHVTDATTNSQFNDKFFQDISFPLNKVLFVFSFNNKEKIDPILLDRMQVIKVESYSIEDKIQIVNKHLIKEAKNDIGLNDIEIKISDENITHLVDTYTNEGGVRRIKDMIEKILLKINKDRIFKSGIFEKEKANKRIKSIELTRSLIDGYLPKHSITSRKIHKSPEVGVVNGMYVLSSGNDGGILPILMYKNQMGKGNKFVIKVTGNQKRVMTESIEFAFTIAINFIKPKYGKTFFKDYPNGLHVHNPDASVKDGPSAGSSNTLAFISKILNKKVKNDVALTGEIDHDGRIGAIGGLDGKLVGSKKAGVRLCFVPKDNEKDVDKIKLIHKTLFDDNFRIMIVSNIKEILEYALIDNDEIENNTFEKSFDVDKYLVDKCSTLQKQKIFVEESVDSDDSENNGKECSDEECESSDEDNSDEDNDSDSSSDRSK